jgi:Predicted methyltransferase
VIIDRMAFIRAETRLIPAPHTPSIILHIADEATDLWQKTEEELGIIGLPPPFWAFAWAGGQALARYLLLNPDIVRGKRVLDFASGSGIVGIAAAMAGAAKVEACDIDPFAIDAIILNAEANKVSISPREEDVIGRDDGWDIILAGDICYERDTASRVIDWLEKLAENGRPVLFGDPGRSYLPKDKLESLATYEVPVTRSLEDSEIKKTSVWRFR